MPVIEILRLSLEALWANKFRSVLTMLGLVIGVGAVVLLVSLGNGAKNYVTKEFEGLGTNLIVIQPGRADKKSTLGPPIGAAQRKMTLSDVLALEKKSFNLDAVTGLLYGTITVRYADAINNSGVFGCNENLIKILNLNIAHGQFFSREDDESGRRFVVLGYNVAQTLFDEENPLGVKIKLNQSEFRVVGVMEKTGNKLGFSFDDFVFIPTHAGMRLFNDDKLFGIRAKARSRTVMDDAVAEIKDILKERRDGEEDFTVVTQLSMMETMDTILNMLTWVLVGIAAVSMVVGGVGIMNIMLVSVAERTQEIGIRRAVGARRSDIMKQFLAEAVALSLTGGLIGLFGAVLITHIASYLIGFFDMRAPFWVLPPAFLLSIAVGVIFGVWPARKAAMLQTLDALRAE